MKVIFNGKDVGYACVEYIEYIDGQKSLITFDTNFEEEDQDKTIWNGVKKIMFTLENVFLKVEGFDSTDNIICTRILPIRRILEVYTTSNKPLQMNALTSKEAERAQ